MLKTRFFVRFTATALFLAVLLCGCQASASNIRKVPPAFAYDGQQTLSIVSFNIRVGYGARDRGLSPVELKGRRKRLAPIVSAIRSCDADIVGLQEVLGHDQARELAQRLNMNFAYTHHPTFSPYGPWWGVALLSKYPIVAAEGFQVSFGAGNTKNALLCGVNVGGRVLHFVSIHKDKDLKDGASFKRIMRKIKPMSGAVVLIGDLNMTPFDARLRILKSRFRDSADNVDSAGARAMHMSGTFPGIGRIDYVMVDPNHFKVLDVGLADRRYRDASDHLAYWAKIVPIP